MSLYNYLSRFSRKSYPVFEIGALVSYGSLSNTNYGRVISSKHLEAMTGSLLWREQRNYKKGILVCVQDSLGWYRMVYAEILRRIENPQQVIDELLSAKDKVTGKERVEIVRTIEFLEDSLRIQTKH